MSQVDTIIRQGAAGVVIFAVVGFIIMSTYFAIDFGIIFRKKKKRGKL